jgi:hypothetical protein
MFVEKENILPIAFIYRPRSGDRVLAEYASPYLVICRWPNGCRHVVGGVHLRWETARPKAYWRNIAAAVFSAAAKAVAENTGRGVIVWDDRGFLHVVVEPLDAKRFYRLAESIRPKREGDEISNIALQNIAAMAAAGFPIVPTEEDWELEEGRKYVFFPPPLIKRRHLPWYLGVAPTEVLGMDESAA